MKTSCRVVWWTKEKEIQGHLMLKIVALSWRRHDRCLPLEGAGEWQIVSQADALLWFQWTGDHSQVDTQLWVARRKPAEPALLFGLLGTCVTNLTSVPEPHTWICRCCFRSESAAVFRTQVTCEPRHGTWFVVVVAVVAVLQREIRVGICVSSVKVKAWPLRLEEKDWISDWKAG